MKIPETTAQALHEAMDRFDKELRNTTVWERWEQDETHRYALEQDGKLYPVKQIVSMATGFPVGQFSGGDQANGFVEKYGFNSRPCAQWKALINELHPVSISPSQLGGPAYAGKQSTTLSD
jgi:hypothetical protein